jgi:hypothetical protein
MTDHPISQLQAMIDGMGAAWQRERAATQMTLGVLIEALEALPADRTITGLAGAHSYRGYYCDLAFKPASEVRTVGELLAECRAAMGEVFEGYKGGDFTMGRTTPLWVACWGDCGERLMGLATDTTPIRPITSPDHG